MNDRIQKLLLLAGSRDFLLLLTFSFAGFVTLERTGLFRLEPASYLEIFRSLPARVIATTVFINGVAGIVFFPREGRFTRRSGYYLFAFSLMLLSAGLWVSYYTHFEGKALRMEGQAFSAFPNDYLDGSVFRAKYAKYPEVGILMGKTAPEASSDMKTLKNLTAKVSYSGAWTKNIRQWTLSASWPLFTDWTLIYLSDFGYAPTIKFMDRKERGLQTQTLLLRLFPPGQEDFFMPEMLGYTLSFRVYPDYIEKGSEPATRSIVPENPAVNVRVTRFKDIIFSGIMKPTQKLAFDRLVIAVPSVRTWAEITFIRDPGMPLIALAIVVMSAGLILMNVTRQ